MSREIDKENPLLPSTIGGGRGLCAECYAAALAPAAVALEVA